MKILVTGGAGFIGSHLVDKLIAQGHKVVVVDNLSSGKREQVNGKAMFYENDILDSALGSIFEKERPEAVFHLAAEVSVRKSIEDPIKGASTNILGFLNVFEQCKKFGIEKVVFASTGGAMYGEADEFPTPETSLSKPASPYAISKLAGEMYAQYYINLFDIPVVILRLANVYGPRQDGEGEAGVVAIFKNALAQEVAPTIFGNGTQTRDFVFVEDVVSAHIAALEHSVSGVFNVGGGKETLINELLEKMQKIAGTALSPSFAKARAGEQQKSCLHIAKAQKELEWNPQYSLEDGLEKTIFYKHETYSSQ
jgi:UDP-glucose 4-epimerase